MFSESLEKSSFRNSENILRKFSRKLFEFLASENGKNGKNQPFLVRFGQNLGLNNLKFGQEAI